jgi:hypothetical protein
LQNNFSFLFFTFIKTFFLTTYFKFKFNYLFYSNLLRKITTNRLKINHPKVDHFKISGHNEHHLRFLTLNFKASRNYSFFKYKHKSGPATTEVRFNFKKYSLLFNNTKSNYSDLLALYKVKTSSILALLPLKRIILNLNFISWDFYKNKSSYFFMRNVGSNFRPNKVSYTRSIWVTYISSYTLIVPRKRFQFLFNRNYLYQKPLTSFLTSLYNFKSLEILYWNELQLYKVLLKSSFFYHLEDIIFFISKGWVLLNFKKIYSVHTTLSISDLIIFKYNIYIFNFFKLNFFSLNSLYFKFILFFYKTQRRLFRSYPQTPSYRVSNKILNKNFFYLLPVIYLEIDWFSMSLIVLNIFILFKLFIFYLNWVTFSNSSIRAYNWKYLS